MNTLLLDRTVWDLTKDATGNIALAAEPYALAQDAASEIRLFQGELWYDTTRGIPYFAQVLGKPPSVPFMKAQFTAAALLVPDVDSAQTFITSIVNRDVAGQVQIRSAAGTLAAANFGRTI